MTTDDRLLAEDLLLLAWNPDSGRPQGAMALQLTPAIGGALLLDLALRDRLRIEVDVPRASSRPTGDALLDEVTQLLREGRRRRKLKGWVRKVGTTARRDQVRDRLVARGLLVAEHDRVLGLFPRTRHRLADAAEVVRLEERVREVLVGGPVREPRLAVLVALVGGTAVLDRLVPRRDRRDARRRAEELAEDSPVAEAARVVIRDTQAAMIATFAGAVGAASGR